MKEANEGEKIRLLGKITVSLYKNTFIPFHFQNTGRSQSIMIRCKYRPVHCVWSNQQPAKSYTRIRVRLLAIFSNGDPAHHNDNDMMNAAQFPFTLCKLSNDAHLPQLICNERVN